MNDDPNGIINGAAPINLGDDREPFRLRGNIGEDGSQELDIADIDLFKIVVPDEGLLSIDIDTPYTANVVDSFLRVFSEDGTPALFEDTGGEIISDNDFSFDATGNLTEFSDPDFPDLVFEDESDRTSFQGHTSDSFITATVKRGEVYYIGISESFNTDYDPTNLNNRPAAGTGGVYDLLVTFVNNDIDGSISPAIPDLSLEETARRDLGLDENSETGEIIEVGDRDVDFVKFRTENSGILEIDLDSSNQISIIIFDAEGNQLAIASENNSFDSPVRYEVESDRDYYIAFTGSGNEDFDPYVLGSGSGGDTGEYTFTSQLLPISDRQNFSDNTIDSDLVRELTIDVNYSGNVGKDENFLVGADDIDLYRFIPTVDGEYNIRLETNEELSADTFLRVFDLNGNEIGANDNENSNTIGSFLQIEAQADTEYIIGVNGASANAGDYDPITGEEAAEGSQGNYNLSLNPNDTGGDPLSIVDFDVTPSGFTVEFDRPLLKNLLDLYDGEDESIDEADLILQGENSGEVPGSLFWNEDNLTLEFVKSGDALEADNYTLTLFSRESGFLSNSGSLLDGDGDGIPGGDFTREFSTEIQNDRILNLTDFTRGPEQAVNIPISIDNASGVEEIELTIIYNPDLLGVTGVSLDENLPNSWEINEQDLNTPGQVRISLSGEALDATETNLVQLDATVPEEAVYGDSQLLQFESVELNEGEIDVIGNEAIHNVAYLGDSNGDREYSYLDAVLHNHVAVGVDTGFDAYPLTNPQAIADVTGDGEITAFDAAIVAREAINLPQSEIPDLPIV